MRGSYRLSLVGRARQPLKGLGTAGANKTADRPGSGSAGCLVLLLVYCVGTAGWLISRLLGSRVDGAYRARLSG